MTLWAPGMLVLALGILIPSVIMQASLERGEINTQPLKWALWAALIFGFALAITSQYGLGSGLGFGPGLILIAVLVIAVIGLAVLPLVGYILAIYGVAYLYWYARGRKRRTDADLNEAVPDRKPVKGRMFGNRDRWR